MRLTFFRLHFRGFQELPGPFAGRPIATFYREACLRDAQLVSTFVNLHNVFRSFRLTSDKWTP